MAGWGSTLRPHVVVSSVLAGSLLLSAGFILGQTRRRKQRDPPWDESPVGIAAGSDPANHPYPPDALPGARDVPTPYGCIRVYEWGPPSGAKVLLLHGISTPSPMFAALAAELVSAGHRVMVFDLFGRGYSDAPRGLPHDARLYTAQILLALASSALPWTGDEAFHLVGYSLGGGLAVAFAAAFPHVLRSVVLLAPGGLVRRDHVGWRARWLYSDAAAALMPARLREGLVRRRLEPKVNPAASEETAAAAAAARIEIGGGEEARRQRDSDTDGGDAFGDTVLRPATGHTISEVVAWQLRSHGGFVRAFVSTIRHAPIYEAARDWVVLGRLLAARRGEREPPPGLRDGKVLAVLGVSDSVVVADEFVQDATAVLGDEGLEVVLVDAGHEFPATRSLDVADAMISFWQGRGVARSVKTESKESQFGQYEES